MSAHSQNNASDNWQGYEWQVPLDELIDCSKCPVKCQTCYYRGKHAPKYFKAIYAAGILGLVLVIVALMVRFGTYSSKQYLMGAGDQRLLMNNDKNKVDFSRLFCKGFDVKSELEQLASAHIFTKEPSFLHAFEEYDKVQTVEIGGGLYPIWANHLNGDGHYHDTITVKACAAYFIDFYLFKKKSDLDKFIANDGWCSDCVQQHCPLHPCHEEGPSQCEVLASYTGNHYMTMTAGPLINDIVDVTFHFRRSRFDLSEAQEHCSSMSQCSVNLPKHTKAIILTLPTNSSIDADHFTTNCVADIGMYFAFFFAVPMGISFVFGLFACCLMKLQESVMKDVEQADLQRQYREMGYRTNSAVVPSTSSARQDSAGNPDQQRPPPAYHEPIRIFTINSDRVSLRENEQPVSQSLPDYSSAVEESLGTEDAPPSYGSIGLASHDSVA